MFSLFRKNEGVGEGKEDRTGTLEGPATGSQHADPDCKGGDAVRQGETETRTGEGGAMPSSLAPDAVEFRSQELDIAPLDARVEESVEESAARCAAEPPEEGAEEEKPAGNEDAAGGDGPTPWPTVTNPPALAGPRRPARGKRLVKPEAEAARGSFTPPQRLLLLDTWRRSGLPAKDFAALVGLSKHTLYKWKQQFEQQGPEGLMDQPRGACRGSRLPELTKRTILMLKQSHPEWGCQRISDMLLRGPALPASASAVARVLHEAGYQLAEEPARPHTEKVRRFERAKPNQLWQTDLFTFVLKRQNRRVYVVAFMDDHSRFIVSYGLHASQSTALVLEALEAGIASYGPPEEVLTDNGTQFVTWRGKSQFTRRLEQRGIRQIVARPQRPQTLGKIERFWGTLWREFLETAVFLDLADARTRIGLFIDYHNFQRVHRGIGGLVPADRFFGAAEEVLRTLKQRVAANALELARHGAPRPPFYVTGQVDGQSFSVHGEGERLILTRAGEPRQEIELAAARKEQPACSSDENGANVAAELPSPVCPDGSPCSLEGEPAEAPPAAPGQSALDELLDGGNLS